VDYSKYHILVFPDFLKKTPNEHFYERQGDALQVT